MSKKKNKVNNTQVTKDFLEPLLYHKYEHLIFIGLLFVLLSIFFFRMAYLGYGPRTSDTIQWRGAAQVLLEYNEEHSDQALWNTNLFSGMPAYLISYPARFPFIKNIFNLFTKYLINWTVFYMFLAGLGMYILMLSLGFKPIIAFITGMSFAISCHFIGLIEIGHNTKFRAIVYIPWIFWGLHHLFKYKNILGMGLTAMFLIQQLRENHVQITYYTFIMIIIYWIFNFFWAKKDIELKEFAKASIMFAGVLIITGLAVAHPYLNVWEYGEYTIRGGGGLTADYATSWSLHPFEIITFIIPDFFGGISPYYWGWMPFTQTSHYMGVVIFILALIAIFSWKERMVKMFTVVTVVALFLSFGKHFQFLSNFLLSYLPLFNKFRVPAMILVLVQFSIVVLAGYGIKQIFQHLKEYNDNFTKLILKLLIICIAITILFIAISETNGFSFLPLEHSSDSARYEPRQLEFLKQMRLEVLEKSSITAFAFLSLFFLVTYLLLKRKGMTPYLYLLIIGAISITDVMLINKKHFPGLSHKVELEQEFVKTEADRFLLEDESLFRIFPLREEFDKCRWAYYHQTIGGYHGAKLQRYQDILDYSLHAELRYRVPINWNIVRMLNVKYLISPIQLPFDNLEWSYYDRERQVTIYSIKNSLPRAWFVDEVETIVDKQSVFRRLNSPDFNPETSAIVETSLMNIEPPNETSVKVTDFNLHNITLDITTDKNSFLVLSEVFYPAGWNAYLNGKQVEIHPTNYILRGVEVPPGDHELEIVFEPLTHKLGVIFSFIGIFATLVLLVIGIYWYWKNHFCGGIDYIIKD